MKHSSLIGGRADAGGVADVAVLLGPRRPLVLRQRTRLESGTVLPVAPLGRPPALPRCNPRRRPAHGKSTTVTFTSLSVVHRQLDHLGQHKTGGHSSYLISFGHQ